MRRYLLLGAVLVLAIVGARVLKNRQGSDPEPDRPSPSSSPSPRAPAGASAARVRSDAVPIPLLADPAPAGSLRLQGLVLGPGDLPAPDAVVSVEANPPRAVRADKGGTFLFERLPPGLYRLEARQGGMVAGPVTVALKEGTEPVTLRLRTAATVEVEVVDARTRAGLPGAALELRGESVLPATADAAGKGTFEGVRPGRYVARAAAPGHAPALVPVTVGDSSTNERVTIELATGAAASGEVRDDRGRPVAGIPVVAEMTSTLVSLADARHDGVRTDDRGRWRFPALAAGTYRFVASDAAHPPASSAPTALDGERDKEGILIQMGESARLAGQVVTRSGDPVPFALVRAVVNEGAVGQVLARQSQCNDRGEFSMGGLPRKLVDVVALHETATSATQKIDLAENPDRGGVVLALDADGTIPGVVLDASSQPVPEAVVLADPAQPGGRSRAEVTLRGRLSAVTDAAGKFELRGLSRGGSYLLRAAPPGTPLTRRTSWLRAPVRAEATGKEVMLRLEGDGRVKGRVQREQGGVPDVFSVAVDGAGGFTSLGGSGAFALQDIPPGTHTLAVSGPSFVTKVLQDVVVKADGETDVGVIAVTSGRRITGRVLREDGTPVPGATVTVSRPMAGAGVVAGPAAASVADVRQAVSGADGSYALEGMGIVPLNLGAEHPREGRSAFTQVPVGTEDVKADLLLKATGGLRGTITQKGNRVSGALVLASTKGAPSGGSGVTTGTDGSYQFDSLTPGTYVIAAMLDTGGGQNVKQGTVTVQATQTATLDLDLPLGTVTLVVHPSFVGSIPTTPVQVVVGRTNAPGAPSGPPSSFLAQTIQPSDAARFQNVEPGSYRVCAGVIPARPDAGSPPPADVKMGCVFHAVGASPPVQDISVTVPAPAPAP